MLKKAKFWVPVAVVAALTLTGSVYAATSSSSQSTTTPSTTQHAHQGKKWGQHQAGFMGFMGFNKQDNTALLSLLKIDAATFKQDLQSGKSIADIATQQGVTEQQVIDLLTQNATTQLDQAVKNGKMTQAQEDKIKANLATRIKKQVESKHSGQFQKGRHGKRGGEGFQLNNQALLSLLKLDATTLKQDLQSGQSLADIATKQGVTEQQVIDLLTQNATTQLDQAVKNGKMTQAQEDKIKANLATLIKAQVENKHTERPHGQWGQKTQTSQTQSQSQSQSGSNL